jgi:hypothetical protein
MWVLPGIFCEFSQILYLKNAISMSAIKFLFMWVSCGELD